MPRKKKPQSEALITTERTATMQHEPPKKKGGHNAKNSTTRKRFLEAFEKTFGNISASCEYAGINRITYYRWLKSTTRINQRFRERVELIKPKERYKDFLEGSLVDRIKAGDTVANIFALKSSAKDRGYGDQPAAALLLTDEVLDRVAQAYQAFLSDHPELTFEDKWKWLVRFANGAKERVEPKELAKRVGLDQAQQGANE